jgi:hypothetical protein
VIDLSGLDDGVGVRVLTVPAMTGNSGATKVGDAAAAIVR